jgi:hypothetical protein
VSCYRPQPTIAARADQAPRANHDRFRSQLRPRAGPWRLSIWMMLGFVGLLFLTIFQVWTLLGLRANIVHLGTGPTEVEMRALSAVGTTWQPEPTAPATAPVRDNIREGMPGWDSIRRENFEAMRVPVAKVSLAPAVSAHAAAAPQSALAVVVPVVLGLLVPVLGWVGLYLALRSVASSSCVPAGGPDDTLGPLLRVLRERVADHPDGRQAPGPASRRILATGASTQSGDLGLEGRLAQLTT